jgi:hypothetical protein
VKVGFRQYRKIFGMSILGGSLAIRAFSGRIFTSRHWVTI